MVNSGVLNVELGDLKLLIKPHEYLSRNEKTLQIRGDMFYKILEILPPNLTQKKAKQSLDGLYEVGFHMPTRSIYICNKGASLHTKTPETKKDYLTYHFGFGIYMPNHGLEAVNVGIVGDLANSKTVVVRPESACAPSFLFGSQRCNCYDQWILAKELAGYYGSIDLPKLQGIELEEFIQNHFQKDETGLPKPKINSQGFLLIHLDSQNGMGSGAMRDKYNPDLTLTAFLRHRGEYSAEQIFSTSMAGGFSSIGLLPDPRVLNDNSGYKIPSVILDYFGITKPLIALTNNQKKIDALRDSGHNVQRVGFYARADSSCYLETEDRRNEFGHIIPKEIECTLEQEFQRVKDEIDSINEVLK